MSTVKKKLKIEGMHCSSCAMNIDMDLEDLKGVKSANTNYAKQVSEVEFIEGEVSTDKIVEQIEKTGYKATVAS